MQFYKLDKLKEDKIIEDNEYWFGLYNYIPLVTTLLLGFASLILGIVFAIEFDSGLFIIIFWFGGAFGCLINYFFSKLILSYKILHIYYLKKLTLSCNSATNQAPNEKEAKTETPKEATEIKTTTAKTPATNDAKVLLAKTPTTNDTKVLPNKTVPIRPLDTWTCKKCGYKNKTTSIYCKSCGEYK